MKKQMLKTPSQRQLRVGEELRQALAAILGRGDLRDPDLLDVIITVTEVRVSPDLRNATVFVTALGVGASITLIDALTRASPHLRHGLAQTVRLRYVPTITFEADRSFDYADHIEALLRDPAVARDLDPAQDGESDDHGA